MPASTTSPAKPPRARRPSTTLPSRDGAGPWPHCWARTTSCELLKHMYIGLAARNSAVLARYRVQRRARGRRAAAPERPDRAGRRGLRAALVDQFRTEEDERRHRTRATRGMGVGNGVVGEMRAAKHFYSIISPQILSSELAEHLKNDLRERLDRAAQIPGVSRLPRASVPIFLARSRITAPFRSSSACARYLKQQHVPVKRRALRMPSWSWLALARAQPFRGRGGLEAHQHAVRGCSARSRAPSELLPCIRVLGAARTRVCSEICAHRYAVGGGWIRQMAVLGRLPGHGSSCSSIPWGWHVRFIRCAALSS